MLFRSVLFEGGELAPAVPVIRFESAIDAHGGDVTVGAAEGAIAGGREGVGESGLADEAGGGGEDAAGGCFVDGEVHSSSIVR